MKTRTITWAGLVRLKKAAKAAKVTLPHLTHMQRLDAIAATEYGVRHFHELQKQYEALVAGHVEVDGEVHHCRFCFFTFDGSLQADVKAHNERHQNFVEAEAALGFLPMPYRVRERLKRFGYERVHSPDPTLQRHGALAVLLSHFERSMERAIEVGRWHKHPYFAEYLAYALPGAGYLPQPVRQRLSREFGEKAGLIPDDCTHWPSRATVTLKLSATDAAASRRLRQEVADAAEAFANGCPAVPTGTIDEVWPEPTSITM